MSRIGSYLVKRKTPDDSRGRIIRGCRKADSRKRCCSVYVLENELFGFFNFSLGAMFQPNGLLVLVERLVVRILEHFVLAENQSVD